MEQEIIFRGCTPADLPDMVRIWNEVVEEGVAFPQTQALTIDSGREFFAQQSYCGVAEQEADVIARTDYGVSIVAAVQHGNVYGCQFHPEKSGEVGLQILKNFGELNR